MQTCFMIQPFDRGKYDKRFREIFSPAITAAGLEPYRVDQDPGVEVTIEAIEKGIQSAAVCLAEISTDNPNVWYELGYALALGRPVIMICSSERSGKYPFDIQHRNIAGYEADSIGDFQHLQHTITARLTAKLAQTARLETIRDSEQVAPVHGLTQPELAVLAAAAGTVDLPNEGASAYGVKKDVENAGFNSLGFSVGLRRLVVKQFLELREDVNYNGDSYQAVFVTSAGWDWIERNEEQFTFRKSPSGGRTGRRTTSAVAVDGPVEGLTEDDIPF